MEWIFDSSIRGMIIMVFDGANSLSAFKAAILNAAASLMAEESFKLARGFITAAGLGAAAGICAAGLYRKMPAGWVCDAGEEIQEAHMPHMRRHGRAAGIGCAAAVTLLLLKYIFFSQPSPFFAAVIFHIFSLIFLAAAAQCDAQYQIIPDQASAFILAAGLICALSAAVTSGPAILLAHIGGASAGFLTMFFCSVLSQLFCGREGIGMGDVKLIGACGALIGIRYIFYLILISSLTSSVFLSAAILFRRAGTQSAAPMAPWIFLGTASCLIIL